MEGESIKDALLVESKVGDSGQVDESVTPEQEEPDVQEEGDRTVESSSVQIAQDDEETTDKVAGKCD